MREIKFLHWNINRKNLLEQITELSQNIDILLLVENFEISDEEILKKTGFRKLENFDETCNKKIITPQFYTRLEMSEFQYCSTGHNKRFVFASLKIGEFEEILIIGMHFPSKMRKTDDNQERVARNCIKEIVNAENKLKLQRTLIVGDFNMNPFEKGMYECDAFNATLSEIKTKGISQKVDYNNYDFFYNPIWSLLGDRNCETGKLKLPGTYYFEKDFYWNIFDQVIMRPSVIPFFDFKTLKIIEKSKTYSLTNENHQIKTEFSDHLPLTFSLNFSEV